MMFLGLRSSGRLGLSPRRRLSSLPQPSPDQVASLALRYCGGDSQNTATSAEIDLTAKIGVTSALATGDQLKLIDGPAPNGACDG